MWPFCFLPPVLGSAEDPDGIDILCFNQDGLFDVKLAVFIDGIGDLEMGR